MDLVSRLDAAEQLFESPTNFSCPRVSLRCQLQAGAAVILEVQY